MNKPSISDGHFIIEFFWMSKLGLKGNELRLYALIYSYSQDKQGGFFGSIEYIKQRLSISRRAVFNLLQSLVERELIEKIVTMNGNITMYTYEIVPNKYTGAENAPPVQKVHSTSAECAPNNKELVKDVLEKTEKSEIIDKNRLKSGLELFDRHHILTRYLINAGYLTQRDYHQMFRYDRYFDMFIGQDGYTFDDYKLFVQYFVFRNQERINKPEFKDKPLKNKYGYFITAMEKARWEFSQVKVDKMKAWKEEIANILRINGRNETVVAEQREK